MKADAAIAAGIRLGPSDVVGTLDGPAGAYLHVPFCERICPFCPYNKVCADPDLARRYFEALRREVDGYVAEYERVWHGPFPSLYIGGGTPTLYPNELAKLLPDIPVSGERAIEVLPGHGTPKRYDQLVEIGVTAVSVGAQSFHDRVLRRLCRPHDAADARRAVENALGRFACVDVDLIFDVAWDDQDALLDDVRRCFDLGVDQVSTYPLMRFGYTPFGPAHHDLRLEHEVLAKAGRLARGMGYERRTVWTFNRRGSPAYTSITRPRFLGMGAGSSSFTGRDFYVNHFGVTMYVDAVARGSLPIARRFHLGRWGGAAYDAFWQAYAGGVDCRSLDGSYGRAVGTTVRAGLAPFERAGLVRRAPDGYRLTQRGFDAYHDLERLVTYGLIEPLWAEMLREHAASNGSAAWAAPRRARAGPLWWLARRLFERRPPDDQGWR